MKALLCIDSEIIQNPQMAGLDLNIFSDDRVVVKSDGESARQKARELSENCEAFVVSADDVSAINLVAAIKKDTPNLKCNLVVSSASGSLQSRAQAAGVTRIIKLSDFEKSVVECLSDERLIFDDSMSLDIQRDEAMKSDRSWSLGFFSGSGGSGKSVISSLCASLLSSMGKATILIDADFQFGDVSTFDKSAIKINMEDAIADANNCLQSARTKVSEDNKSLVILCSPFRLEISEAATRVLPDILSEAKNNFEAVVVNTGSNWSDAHAHLLGNLDSSVFVVDQRVSSIRATKHALELASRLNLASNSFAYCINRCNKKSLLSALDVSNALGSGDVFEILDGGISVEENLSSGYLSHLIKTRNPTSMSVFDMLSAICPVKGRVEVKDDLLEEDRRQKARRRSKR